jgi:hypothetical protein
LQEERKTLDRELARAKVTANRVATVVANEWKDANDKVMPVKQWLDERRFLQVTVELSFVSFYCLISVLNFLHFIKMPCTFQSSPMLIHCCYREKCSNFVTSLL